jgi:hypothetical protein
MNTRLTWLLFLVATALGGYVAFTELGREDGQLRNRGGAEVRFSPILARDVTAVELLRSNTVVRVERQGEAWAMKLPVAYPGLGSAIDTFLENLAKVTPSRWLSAAELAAGGTTNLQQAFGFEGGSVTIKLETSAGPVLLKLGGPTPIGEQLYLQRPGTEGLFVVANSLLASLPRTADHWRDRSLLNLEGVAFDRFEVRGKTPGFEAQKAANGRWRLTKPLNARADGARIETVINALKTARVAAFLSDAPNLDLEPLGLLPPENEFILSRGTNEVVRLQIGNIPADATNFVRLRLPATTNVVLAPVAVGQLARLALPNFRDRQLLPPLTGLTRIELQAGTNQAAVELRGTNWWVTSPAEFPADGDLVRYWLGQLPGLGIVDFANDVVADYAAYGLDLPVREYRFVSGTNTVAHLQFGKTDGPERIFVRRLDEPAVYSVALGAFLQQPEAGSQFRELRFAAADVAQIEVRQLGKTRTLTRDAQGEWRTTAGAPAVALSAAVEEAVHRLGTLQSVRYAVPDESQFTRLPSYQRLGYEVTLTLKGTAPLRSLRLRLVADLGATAVALVQADGAAEPLRLEIPGPLAVDLQRELTAQ